jgi:hypothetical protein
MSRNFGDRLQRTASGDEYGLFLAAGRTVTINMAPRGFDVTSDPSRQHQHPWLQE